MLLGTKCVYSLQNSDPEGLIFIVMTYRGGVFGKKLSHEDNAFMNVISALTRRNKSETISLSTRWAHSEMGTPENQEVNPHQKLNQLAPCSWISSLQDCEGKKEKLLFKLLSL